MYGKENTDVRCDVLITPYCKEFFFFFFQGDVVKTLRFFLLLL